MKININGKEYGVHWGMGALRIVCEKTGFTIEKVLELVVGMGQHDTLTRNNTTCDFVIAAIRNYNNINGTEGEPTFNEVEVYNDEASEEEQRLVSNDLLSSMLRGKTISEYTGIQPTEKKSQEAPQ